MKKLTAILILLAASLSFATVEDRVAGPTTNARPLDIDVISLSDDDVTDDSDSLGVDSANVYGPYALAPQNGPMYKYMRVFCENGVVTSGDSLEISYQVIPTMDINDTISSWTVFDTVASTGKVMTAVDLSGVVAKGVVFRIWNIDASASQIAKPIRVVFKRNETWEH